MTDLVNHPPHYSSHPSGVECIEITEHMGFNLGNAVKYIWRADEKGAPIEDLEKARWYIDREIQKRNRAAKESEHGKMADCINTRECRAAQHWPSCRSLIQGFTSVDQIPPAV